MDAVKAYVGMRKISLGRVGPGDRLRPLLNNEFVFQLGFLDQVWSHTIRECDTRKCMFMVIQWRLLKFLLFPRVWLVLFCGCQSHACWTMSGVLARGPLHRAHR